MSAHQNINRRGEGERLAALEDADPSLTPLLAAIVSRFAKTPPQWPELGRSKTTEEPNT